MKYRADIDGLRAVAVLAVLFFHADIGCSGGYSGVDIFFVLSGYLITSLILGELDTGRFQVFDFLERRARRILPALTVAVFSTLIAGWFLFLPSDFRELGQSVVALALLASNIYFWRESDYWAQDQARPLLHTWSLAVEEQFYLLFPFVLIGIRRFAPHISAKAIFLLLCVSFGLGIYCSHHYPSASFYSLPTRAWEFLIGSLLAVIPTRKAHSPMLMEALSWAGALTILYTVIWGGHGSQLGWIISLLPCLGTAMVIWANSHKETTVGKLLAAPPLVFVGLISFSLYLWHWPVLVFAKYISLDTIGPWERVLLLIVSVAIAVLSWRFVETPFRTRNGPKNSAKFFGIVTLTTVVMLCAGLGIHRSDGIPSRIPAAALKYVEDGKIARGSLRKLVTTIGLQEAINGNFIRMGVSDQSQPIDVFVWGDSLAGTLIPVLDTLCQEYSIRGVAAVRGGTSPLIGFPRQGKHFDKDSSVYNEAVLSYIRRANVSNVVLVANWARYSFTEREITEVRHALVQTIRALSDSGSRVWIMQTAPMHHWNVPQALASAVLRGLNLDDLGLPLIDHSKSAELQRHLFEGISIPGVSILKPEQFFLNSNNRYRIVKDGKALYCDATHLTPAGAMLLRPLFEPIVQYISDNRVRPINERVSP